MGSGGGLSGPLAFLCSLALGENQIHINNTYFFVCNCKSLEKNFFFQYILIATGKVIQQTPCNSHPAHTRSVPLSSPSIKAQKKDQQAKQDTSTTLVMSLKTCPQEDHMQDLLLYLSVSHAQVMISFSSPW